MDVKRDSDVTTVLTSGYGSESGLSGSSDKVWTLAAYQVLASVDQEKQNAPVEDLLMKFQETAKEKVELIFNDTTWKKKGTTGRTIGEAMQWIIRERTLRFIYRWRSQLVTVLNIWSNYVTHAADLNFCIPFPAPAQFGKIDQHMLLAAESILGREVKRMDELAEFQRHLNACWQIKIESLQMGKRLC
ncbi:hypothetical protein T02_8894 [Trichinella nativa]|uniref:Uncharacterized protein n=1 Tax=Trichinella nativa TaxID=6335 RepID=A0A0V1KS21_9BILA|nr:hypothetical protein T02_8894 [Trichinella nativa]